MSLIAFALGLWHWVHGIGSTALLKKITAPTLIMWGEKNPQLPVEHVEQFTARLTAAVSVESIVYPNVGHVIPVEIPGQSALDIEKFLANNN